MQIADGNETTAMCDRVFSKYSCHRHWWTVLPSLPASRGEVDPWATEDGRASRYERLRRVWFDSTWFGSPKADPERVHAFSNPKNGMHASVVLWENFVLFHPSRFIPALVDQAGLTAIGRFHDACWSYEFESEEDGKLTDILVHARSDAGDLALAIEAKFGKSDRLKENPKRGKPDTDPSAYRDLPELLSIPRREAVYLVHDRYAPVVREKVDSTQSYGILTWTALIDLQIRLADLLPRSATASVVNVILWQAHRLGLRGSVPVPSSEALRDAAADVSPGALRNWLLGAAFHIEAVTGQRLTEPPFEYLREEPSFADIHRLPKAKRQTRQDRRALLWRLPS